MDPLPKDPLPDNPQAWSRLLKSNWEARSRSKFRDFYVASHPGWQDKRSWENQAEIDLETILYQVKRAELARWNVLEIGCGVGRLARPLAGRVRSYTGVDISAGMVEQACQRNADLLNARFFESDGTTIPLAAMDRPYQFALAVAVFIHCPKPVILSILKELWPHLEQGAQLRFQVLADVTDSEGLSSPGAMEQTMQELVAVEEMVIPDNRELAEERYYMGDTFRVSEVHELFAKITGGSVAAWRLSPLHIWGWIQK